MSISPTCTVYASHPKITQHPSHFYVWKLQCVLHQKCFSLWLVWVLWLVSSVTTFQLQLPTLQIKHVFLETRLISYGLLQVHIPSKFTNLIDHSKHFTVQLTFNYSHSTALMSTVYQSCISLHEMLLPQFGVQCLAQEYFGMWAGQAVNLTTDHQISGQPAPPS